MSTRGVRSASSSPIRGGRLGTLAAPSVATTYPAHPDLAGVLAVAVSRSGEERAVPATRGIDPAPPRGLRKVTQTDPGPAA